MKPRLPVTLLLVFVMVLIASVQTKKNPELYNIVLVGATGDLAKKYLWKALFNLFNEKFVKEKVNYYFTRPITAHCLVRFPFSIVRDDH